MVFLLATLFNQVSGRFMPKIKTLGVPAHRTKDYLMTETPAVPAAPVPAPTTNELLISPSARPWVSAGFGLPVLGLFSLLYWIADSHAHWAVSWWCGFLAALVLSLLYFGQDLAVKATQAEHPVGGKAIGIATAIIVGGVEIGIFFIQNSNTLSAGRFWMGVACAACAATIVGILFLLSWLSARTRTR